MPNFGAPEILLILLVILLLFGAKRLPDTARGLGRSLRIFKAETKGLRDDADEGTHAPRSATVAREASEPRIIERRPADAGSAVADDRFRDGHGVDERVTGQQPLTER